MVEDWMSGRVRSGGSNHQRRQRRKWIRTVLRWMFGLLALSGVIIFGAMLSRNANVGVNPGGRIVPRAPARDQ